MSGFELGGLIAGCAIAAAVLVLLGVALAGGHAGKSSTRKPTAANPRETPDRADQKIAETREVADARIKAVTDEANRRIDQAEQTTVELLQALAEANEQRARMVSQHADLTRQLVALRVDHKTVLTENEQLARKNTEMTAELAKFGPLATPTTNTDTEPDTQIAKVHDGLTEPDPGPAGLTETWQRPPSTRAIRAATNPDSPEYAAAQDVIAALELQGETFDAWNSDTYPAQPAKPDADAVAAEHGPLPPKTAKRVVTKPARASRRARGRHNTTTTAEKAETVTP